mmetsp:Transcript_8356/g.22119  ORF Transcript_8356/g.22119 Transcript_8356/m.22119 type:complete len:566 (+) Transcript_8356:73-1770(+)
MAPAVELAASNPTSPVAAVVLTCALSIAIASLIAALFLRGSGNSQQTSAGQSAGKGSTSPSATSVETETNPNSSCRVAAAGVKGSKKADACSTDTSRPAAPASVPTRGSSSSPVAPKAPASKIEPASCIGPPLESGRELWLLRTIAVQSIMDSLINDVGAGSSVAVGVADDLKHRVWRYLDDRPRFVASGCADGQGRIFDLATGKLLVSVRHDFSSRQPLTTVLLTRPGPELLTTTWDGKRHTWEEWPSKPARAEEFARGEKGVGHENSISGIALSRDGTILACACTIGRVLVYRSECPTVEVEINTSEEVEMLREALKMGDFSEMYLTEPLEFGSVRLDRNMALLKEAGFEGMSTRRDLLKLELPLHLHFRFVGCLTRGHKRAWRQLEHEEAVLCLVLAQENAGEFLYSGSRDRTVRKWDLKDGSCVHVYTGHSSMVRCLAVNGTFLVSGSDDRSLRVWKKDEPTCLRKIAGHTDFVRAVALCATFQQRLVSSGDDLKVFLWDASAGERLRQYDHGGIVCTLFLHQSLLVSVAADKQLRVWQTESAICQRVLRHPGAVTALSVL